MYGQFKFVLDIRNKLYIGFSHDDYHQDICNNLLRNEIKGAGWLKYVKATNQWIPNGKSIGYNVSFDDHAETIILDKLKGLTDEDIIAQMKHYRRTIR